MNLAVANYTDSRIFAEQDGYLNLAITIDEREHLGGDIESALARCMYNEASAQFSRINDYGLYDPYGADRIRKPLLNKFFGIDSKCAIACGSGVNALLYGLATLCIGNAVYIIGDVYPDFPHWVTKFGGTCIGSDWSLSAPEHIARASRLGCKIVHFDRPCLTGVGHSLSEIEDLCKTAALAGILVSVDESYANYYPPSYSAVGIIDRVDNLIVLRGLSKAYWLGGLRFGVGVSSFRLSRLLESHIAPLQVSSLMLDLAAQVYSLGDIGSNLRVHVEATKFAVCNEICEFLGIASVSSPLYVPYFFLAPESLVLFENKKILGKLHPFWSGSRSELIKTFRLSVPLRPERINDLVGRISIK